MVTSRLVTVTTNQTLPRPWQQGQAHLWGVPWQPQKLQAKQWQSRRRQQQQEGYLSSNDDRHTPEPSDDDGMKSSASSRDGQRKKKRKVGVVQRSASRKRDFWNAKPSHSTKRVTPSLLQDELVADKSPMEIEKNLMTSRIHLRSMMLHASGT